MIEGAKAQQSQVQAKVKVKAKVKAEAKVKAVAKPNASVKAVAKPKANMKAIAKPKVDVSNGKSASSLYKKPAKDNDGDKGSFSCHVCVCDIKWHVCIN